MGPLLLHSRELLIDSLSIGMLISFWNCFSSLVGMLLGPRA